MGNCQIRFELVQVFLIFIQRLHLLIFQSLTPLFIDLDVNFEYLCYDVRSYMGVLLASTLVMKLIDACRERIFSRK